MLLPYNREERSQRHGQGRCTMEKHNFQATLPLEDFFHDNSETGLLKRVGWLMEHAHLPYSFFAGLLRIDEKRFSLWAMGNGSIAERQKDTLNQFWNLHLRILELFDFDTREVRRVYAHVDHSRTTEYGTVPPWKGLSLQSYIEKHGLQAI